MDLTEEQWAVVAAHLPERPRTRGRPQREEREILNGILWVLRAGVAWADLPNRYPPYQTCHRRFREWVDDGTLARILQVLIHDLKARGGLDLTACFVGEVFVLDPEVARGEPTRRRGAGHAQAAREFPRTWQWQTARIFLAPYACAVLREMRAAATPPTTSP